MKAILNLVIVMSSAVAYAGGNSNFPLRQAQAIMRQEALIRAGIADGSIAGESCVFFVQALEDMKRNAGIIAQVIGEDTSYIDGIRLTLTANDCNQF